MEVYIDGILDEKINEVFLEVQNHFGVTCGDVEPLDEINLAEMRHEMSMLIGQMIRKQMR